MEQQDVRQGANWTGIIAGVVAGLVIYLVLNVLGAAIGITTIGAGGTDEIGGVRGLALGTAVCMLVSTAIAAYLAGATSARASGFITPAQGRLNGLLTGMLLLVVLTAWSYTTLSSIISSTLGVAGAATSTAASASATVASDTANAANTGNGSSLANLSRSLGLGNEYQALVSGLNRQEINQLIADNSPELNDSQVTAATGVVQTVLARAQQQISASLSNPSQIDNVVREQVQNVQSRLSGPEFTQRLQERGLSAPQAREVTTTISNRVQELQQQGQALEQRATQVGRAAARTTAMIAWVWLACAGLLIGLACWGGGHGGSRWAKVAPIGTVSSDMPSVAAPRDGRPATPPVKAGR